MSREAMNMGSSNNNIVVQMKAVMNEFRQGFSSMRQEMSGFASMMHAMPGAGIVGSGGTASSSQVAPNPTFHSAPPIVGMNESGNIVASGPSGKYEQQALPGMENLSQFVAKNPGSGTIYTPASMTGATGGLSNLVAQTAPLNDPTVTGSGSVDASIFKKLQLGTTDVLGKLGGSKSPAGLLAGALSASGMISSFLPGTDETVQADLLMKRAAFFRGQSGGQVPGGSGSIANSMALQGTATSALDSLNALAAAQSMGLTGGGSEFMKGVAKVSNLTPGMGIEGAMRASGAMQQASSVNMLRGIGIQLRSPDGTMKAPDSVIDDVWKKICDDYKQAYGSARNGGKPSLEEVQIALQPGNSLDSMLDQYFGNDPMLKNMVMNGLLYRAQSSRSLATSSKEDITGVTSTAAVSSLATRYQATTKMLTSTAPTGAAGFTEANTMITALVSSLGSALAESILPIKTFMDTILSAAGGAPTSIIGTLAALFPGKADGGPVQGNTTYLVGERGPELFVPGIAGTIVPNDQIQNKSSVTTTGGSNNTYNFNINIPNANTPEVIAELRKLISNLETNKIVSES